MNKNIAILLRKLDSGGSERQALLLAQILAKRGLKVTVITFYSGGALESEASSSCDYSYISLDKIGRWDAIGFMARLIRTLRKGEIAVVFSFLLGPNLAAAAAKLFLPRLMVFWSLRNSSIPTGDRGLLGRLLWRLEAWLQFVPERIVVNSSTGLAFHARRGIPESRFELIPNGIDMEIIKIDALARELARTELGISMDTVVIGCVARMDPVKNHLLLLESFIELQKLGYSNVALMLIGDLREPVLSQIQARIAQAGVGTAVHILGDRSDLGNLYNAIDIFTLVSQSEGMPNALAESLVAGRYCITSDVGECRALLGESGHVLTTISQECLTAAFRAALDNQRYDLSDEHRLAIRQSVATRYGLEKMGRSYFELLPVCSEVPQGGLSK